MDEKRIVLIFVISAVVIAFAAAYASSHPDGLEWVAEKMGFIGNSSEAILKAPMPDYEIPCVKGAYWSTLLAGILGASITGAVFFLTGIFCRKKSN
ncbi:MAG TPA: PDGLE domain-containing protein [bacterium]|jgi:ABC-type Fe3+ transport system permease subunit|nr:hypothetical protein [Myxococcales bacterium]OQA62175.1 MAG: cobalt transport protein CbiN [bacterium ADurb.Bin270]HPW45732.1 PDGLE domain-containing protein [bacterium]HQC50323.1 PDGLE domain-containing protein [bacterium]HQG12944.1 PDGLE domain-containing protein [bacterium]